MNSILFLCPKSNMFNGTLFYSYEYFCYLKSKNKDVTFYIILEDYYDINFNELFSIKYKTNYNVNIIYKNDLFRIKFNKVIILNSYTYNNLIFSANRIYLFKNDNNIQTKIRNNVITFGYYDYQEPFNIKDELLFFFDNFSSKTHNGTSTFLSGTFPDNYINSSNYLKKEFNKIDKDIINKINNIVYNYYTLDRNNRIIVESFFHKIPLQIINLEKSSDSVIDRYNKCIEFGVEYFDIRNSKLIERFIND